MFGCLRRIGCLILLFIGIAVALWLTRDRWRSRVFGERAAPAVQWHAVTDSGADRARQAVESLGGKTGPVFSNLTAEELGALLLAQSGSRIRSAISDPEVAIDGNEILLRANVQLDSIGDIGDLGPLAGMLKRRETFEARGTLGIVHPGLAEYRVESARMGELAIPRAAISRLVAHLWRGAERPEGAADNGITFPVPNYVGDVRVARGRVTLYKNVQ